MIGAAVALMTKLRNSMSISFFNMVISFQLMPCVIKLILVCDDIASRMRREALGYPRICKKNFGTNLL
jgi:hypothetical protein